MRFLKLAVIAFCLAAMLLSAAQGNCGSCGVGGECTGPECRGSDPGGLFVDPIAFPDPNGYSDPGGPVTISDGISITVTSPGPGSGTVWGPGGSTYSYPEPRRESCPPIPARHLVRDMQYDYCVYKCDVGYQFDRNGDCMRVQPSATPITAPSNQGLEDPNGNKYKIGDKIKISKEKLVLGARCREFVPLLKAAMDSEGTDSKLAGIGSLASMAVGGKVLYERTDPNDVDHPTFSPEFMGALLALNSFSYRCDALFKEYPKLRTQSAPKSTIHLGSMDEASGPPAQIELNLESGPFLAEVVNEGVSLNIDTATARISSLGNNTFGVVYDPMSITSFIVAYQKSVNIQPKNSTLAPFTLSGGQVVMIDARSVSRIVPIASLSGNMTAPDSGLDSMPSNQPSIELTGGLEKLKQLKEMLDTGLITQEDYDSKKAEILAEV